VGLRWATGALSTELIPGLMTEVKEDRGLHIDSSLASSLLNAVSEAPSNAEIS
jgi:hypothetical protein